MSTRTDTRRVVLWQLAATDGAYKFSTFLSVTEAGYKVLWIPRSLIHHISREPLRPGPGPQPSAQRCVCEIEEWFLEKHEL